MTDWIPIRHALISVAEKQGILELAQTLTNKNVKILSTGGTAALLKQHEIPCGEVVDYTRFPEIMGGRVKTLHPLIFGAILGRRNQDEEAMKEHGIDPIDLVVVNLYPFNQTIAKQHEFSDAIENIDIGGVSLLRAAAKNHQFVTVVVDPNDYSLVLNELTQHAGKLSYATRFYLAQKAFAHTAGYDASIANYFTSLNAAHEKQRFPTTLSLQFNKKTDLRYGENPHQNAALYVNEQSTAVSIAKAQQLQGKELSFNNIVDADAAFDCVKSFVKPACVIVKHANPCGVAESADLETAYSLAYETDPTSAFGGIIAFNGEVGPQLAQKIIQQQFVEVIVAPEFSPEALKVLGEKSNLRLLQTGCIQPSIPYWDLKRLSDGLLVQDADLHQLELNELQIVSSRKPTPTEMQDLLFAWKVVKYVKSNAIVYAKQGQTIGIGAGQMSRIDSVNIAATKSQRAHLELNGAVMASDAFFPFRDGVDAVVPYGITAIIQPGGSIRDEEVIAAANEANIAMIFTGIRHFRH